MTWARFDDGFPQHPKVVGLSDAAFRLYVACVCYSARNLTDGRVPRAALPTLLPRGAQKAARELITAALLDDDGQFVIVHDYLDYNPSALSVNSKRDAKSMAGAKGAASRWHSGSHDGRNAPDPVPIPSISRSPSDGDGDGQRAGARDARERLRELAVNMLKRAFVVEPSHRVTWACVDAIEEFGDETVAIALQKTVAFGSMKWAYTERVLETYRQEGITT